jgi:diacylglycerol kinase (ATP)
MAGAPVRIIYNPISGRGHDRRFIADLAHHLKMRGFAVEGAATQHRGHARELARSAPDDSRCVVSIGGDGTHREVISGLVGRPVPICIIPSGTENVLARTFHARSSMENVVRRVQDGKPVPIDLGSANDNPFIMFSGIGLDAAVTKMVHEKRSGSITRSTYYGFIARVFMKMPLPRLTVTVDGQTLADDVGYMLVANMPRYATNLRIAPLAVADDGLLDVVCYRARTRTQLLRLYLETWRGRHLDHPRVAHGRGRRIAVASANGPVPLQVDGDAVGATPVEYSVLPQAVNVLVSVEMDEVYAARRTS